MTGTYGCGLSNPDFSSSPPWGTLNSSGEYSLLYEKYQFVEVGLDLTAFGIDPLLLYSFEASECDIPFNSVLFKSRASQSFTAQLKDFSGPYPFGYSTEAVSYTHLTLPTKA